MKPGNFNESYSDFLTSYTSYEQQRTETDLLPSFEELKTKFSGLKNCVPADEDTADLQEKLTAGERILDDDEGLIMKSVKFGNILQDLMKLSSSNSMDNLHSQIKEAGISYINLAKQSKDKRLLQSAMKLNDVV